MNGCNGKCKTKQWETKWIYQGKGCCAQGNDEQDGVQWNLSRGLWLCRLCAFCGSHSTPPQRGSRIPDQGSNGRDRYPLLRIITHHGSAQKSRGGYVYRLLLVRSPVPHHNPLSDPDGILLQIKKKTFFYYLLFFLFMLMKQ